MDEWYSRVDGRVDGPYLLEQLEERHRSGLIDDQTPVWTPGRGWASYEEAFSDSPPMSPPSARERATAAVPGAAEGASSVPAGPEAFCTQCGRGFARSELVVLRGQNVCAECKPLFLQQMREGVAPATGIGGMPWAGFWIRFGARMIDGVAMFAINMVLAVPMLAMVAMSGGDNGEPSPLAIVGILAMYALQIGAAAAYEIVFVRKYSATPGKMLLRLRVVTADGSPIGWGRSTGRYFATMLSGLTLGIGYIIAAFDAEKRALHDHVAHTRVVHV